MTSDANPPRRGLIDRIAAGYWNFSASAQEFLSLRPKEGVLLSIMLFVLFALMVFDVVQLALFWDTPDEEAFSRVVGELFIGRLLVAPIGFYLFSAIISAIARGFGGKGDWYATRAALVWSFALCAPVFMLSYAIGAAHVVLGDGLGRALTGGNLEIAAFAAPSLLDLVFLTLQLGLGVLTLYITSACLAAAHGFSSPLRVFFAIMGLFVALQLLIFVLWIGLS